MELVSQLGQVHFAGGAKGHTGMGRGDPYDPVALTITA